MTKRLRLPTCSHIDMDRVYGRHQACHLCGRPPAIGFLYECREDSKRETLRDKTSKHNGETNEGVSKMRRQLEEAGLSESVMDAADLGHYTEAQLELLKSQKNVVMVTIQHTMEKEDKEEAYKNWRAMLRSANSVDGASSSKVLQEMTPSTCNFKACHSCRPYFRERVPISIQSVLLGNFPPLTHDDLALLPVKSPVIMRTIGTKTPPSSSISDFESSLESSEPSDVNKSETPPGTALTSSFAIGASPTKQTTDASEATSSRSPRKKLVIPRRRHALDLPRSPSRKHPFAKFQTFKSATQKMFHTKRAASSNKSASVYSFATPPVEAGVTRDLGESSQAGGKGKNNASDSEKKEQENSESAVKKGKKPVTEQEDAPLSQEEGSHDIQTATSHITDDEIDMDASFSSDELSVDSFISIIEDDEDDHNDNGVDNARFRLTMRSMPNLSGPDAAHEDEDDNDDENIDPLQSIVTQI